MDTVGLSTVETLLSLGEGIVGEVVQETLEIFEDLGVGGKGFSVRNGGFRFDLKSETTEPHPHASHPFVIEDPIDVMNNVARNAFQCAALQTVCQEALEYLRRISVRPYTSPRNQSSVGDTDGKKRSNDGEIALGTSIKAAAIRNRVAQYAEAVRRTNTFSSATTTVKIATQWGEWSGVWGGAKGGTGPLSIEKQKKKEVSVKEHLWIQSNI